MTISGPANAEKRPKGNHVSGQFRFDINGLRAVAVLGVLLFHFDIPGFAGGFTGVDVFFVISGYLMTQIILGSPRKLTEFYLARIKRLVPALAVMLLTFLSLGLAVVDPMTLQRMAEEALAAILFVSNFFYFLQGNYFAPAAEENWFLHNWSLAVEWQFFALYPIFLGLVARFRPPWTGWVLVIAFVSSFSLAILLPLLKPWTTSLTFYMLPTRLWELVAGGLVYRYGSVLRASWSRWLHFGGLAVIFASFVIFDSSFRWPFGWALFPVMGTAMVIAARHEGDWTRKLPSLGLSSYSIYLWHWPIIVLFAYFSIERSLPVNIGLIVLSILIGNLSYRWFELGLRKHIFVRQNWIRPIAGVSLLGAFVFAVYGTSGFEKARFEQRRPGTSAAAADLRAATADWSDAGKCRGDMCLMNDRETAEVLVIGDSHAEMYRSLLLDQPVAVRSAQGCLPLPGLERTAQSFRCAERTAMAFDAANENAYRRVVLIASWSDLFNPDAGKSATICNGTARACVAPKTKTELAALRDSSFDRLERQIERLRSGGKAVAIMLLSPVSRAADSRRNYRMLFETGKFPASFDRDDFLAETAVEREKLLAIASRQGAEIIDPVAMICNADCPVVWQGRTLYRDTNHYRSSRMAEPIFSGLREAIMSVPE